MLDWQTIFRPSVPVLETFLRGTLVYLTLFWILRFVLKREAGTVGLADLLLIVLIADAAQNAMSADYKSVTDGVLLVATLVFWNYALDWLAFRFPAFERVFQPPPLPLVRDGKMLRRNMRRELITADELMSHVREQGLEDIRDVQAAYMESDGRISVIRRR